MFQSEKEIRTVERLFDKRQLSRVHTGRAHKDLMRSERGGKANPGY
jgi:hypothetical protein